VKKKKKEKKRKKKKCYIPEHASLLEERPGFGHLKIQMRKPALGAEGEKQKKEIRNNSWPPPTANAETYVLMLHSPL
jgi:hypothetical protein